MLDEDEHWESIPGYPTQPKAIALNASTYRKAFK